MTDSKLRELERRWKESQSVEDEAAYLLERVRVGDALEWVAYERFSELGLKGPVSLAASEEALINWIRWRGNQRGEIRLGIDPHTEPKDAYEQTLGLLEARFGQVDHPGGSEPWDETLDLADRPLVVWDFDYYQLSLRLAKNGKELLLAKHMGG